MQRSPVKASLLALWQLHEVVEGVVINRENCDKYAPLFFPGFLCVLS